MGLQDKAATLWALGPQNILRVAFYRIGLKTRKHSVCQIKSESVVGQLFKPVPGAGDFPLPRSDWQVGQLQMFGRTYPLQEGCPDWHQSPLSSGRAAASGPWYNIPDFDPAVGDIKTIWEASRFDWILPLSQRAAAGSADDLSRLNDWLQDWIKHNPPYEGANWKCGQEASIRVMHIVMAALILGQTDEPTPALQAFVSQHLKRIAPTISYAIGQANNHGTSEAAALFIGGSFLGGVQGNVWARLGRKWLENRAQVLIEPDGTFSQYSVTYHRVMLDSYSWAETWRRHKKLPVFSKSLVSRLQAAAHWLSQMIDPNTGDAPVLGANDGAHLFALTGGGYRDFRPSVQWASALFAGHIVYPEGPWDRQGAWLGLTRPTGALTPLVSESFDDGGLHILRAGKAVAYLRYPRFKFRPSQADALHIDFWVDGKNVLRDAGTYSYNVSAEDTAYFNGTQAHNTVEFDGRDQMPRLGRFLFGAWLKSTKVARVKNSTAAAGYKDSWGGCHHRTIELMDRCLTVTDKVSGFEDVAVLRWRLPDENWVLDGDTLTSDLGVLHVSSDLPITDMVLTTGFESRFYLEKSPLPILQVSVQTACTLITTLRY